MRQAAFHSRETRDTLIERALDHVPFDGWSTLALTRALEASGYPKEDAARAFDGDLSEMARHYVDLYNRKLKEQAEKTDLKGLRIRERIKFLVLLRLKLLEDHREAERQVLAFLVEPAHALFGLKLLWSIADTIWYLAGDTATDWNYYSKRILLSGVYSSTVFFWLQDTSPDFVETQAFLSRRIGDVMTVSKAKGFIRSFFSSKKTA